MTDIKSKYQAFIDELVADSDEGGLRIPDFEVVDMTTPEMERDGKVLIVATNSAFRERKRRGAGSD